MVFETRQNPKVKGDTIVVCTDQYSERGNDEDGSRNIDGFVRGVGIEGQDAVVLKQSNAACNLGTQNLANKPPKHHIWRHVFA